MPFIVRFHKTDGFPMYQGGPGRDVNSGVRVANKSVLFRKDAKRFRTYATAQRHAHRCNECWKGEVIEVNE